MHAYDNRILCNRNGFTLIEIIAVLIIISTLAAIAVPKFIDLDANAKDHAIDSGISELNGRESLVWADFKVSPTGFLSDAQVFTAMNYDLGANYGWTVPPTNGVGGGGTLQFAGTREIELERSEATTETPSKWSRK
jgi:prepilin-type N-terminal cleavage/methylation domain-containing protein